MISPLLPQSFNECGQAKVLAEFCVTGLAARRRDHSHAPGGRGDLDIVVETEVTVLPELEHRNEHRVWSVVGTRWLLGRLVFLPMAVPLRLSRR
ncbi:hypothetical protein E1161_04805 [Saccharopolyspora aridisoli]|uniref:Uncharacterized protein n=1 Tax=Saccharopolyspora aridisoli TaxID=2530385 RepID=A0A4R4V7X8_9PSEU|nr:hypothetical protein [Saccharopolyspora aridisoli]TDC95499.1 hypothetical protein E1161_04805 [Saccharopolyspora aridisoli]